MGLAAQRRLFFRRDKGTATCPSAPDEAVAPLAVPESNREFEVFAPFVGSVLGPRKPHPSSRLFPIW
mgnify:CR=1 FL=1